MQDFLLIHNIFLAKYVSSHKSPLTERQNGHSRGKQCIVVPRESIHHHERKCNQFIFPVLLCFPFYCVSVLTIPCINCDAAGFINGTLHKLRSNIMGKIWARYNSK